MSTSSSTSSTLLRLISPRCAHTPRAAATAPLLRAIPHIDYLRRFGRIEFDPALLGLSSVGAGCESTLVAAPADAWAYLRRVECTSPHHWDMPLISRAPFQVWDHPAEGPSGLSVAPSFAQSGGFINSWTDEDRTHFIWGHVSLHSAPSVMAFVWLQNVLAGGRLWRRRELGQLPPDFASHLPMGYISFHRQSGPVIFYDMGAPLPIVRTREGHLHNTRCWLGQRPSIPADIALSDIGSLIWPHSTIDGQEHVMTLDGHSSHSAGVRWSINDSPLPGFVGIYPSLLGGRIDRYQAAWQAWLQSACPMLEDDRITQLLLCMREGLLNADKHGCAGHAGRHMIFVAKLLSSPRVLRVCISDPGAGHSHNPFTPSALQQQQLGRHLGLVLIHGLSRHVQFDHGGSTITFDFDY